MAFKKTLAQRLFNISKITTPLSLNNCRISSPSTVVKALASQNTDKIAPDPGDDGIFRRFLHRRPAYYSPELRSFPTGEKLLEKLRGLDIVKDRIRLDGLIPPPAAKVMAEEEEEEEREMAEGKLTVEDARKLLRLSQVELVKAKLRQIEKSCISYDEFVKLCNETTSFGQGVEIAKMLDQSGTVIVLGNVVFLRPEQVMKAIQGLIPVPTTHQNDDPRMKEELEEMKKQKEAIDKKAESLVRRELWCGLGYLIIQTAAFMRLTFWELSWDVMEPICFYVTSMYFMAGYAFFLRTSKEPSFEGFFQSRFSSKQKRLIKLHNFDLERYNKLRKACYPNSSSSSSSPEIDSMSYPSSFDNVERGKFGNDLHEHAMR